MTTNLIAFFATLLGQIFTALDTVKFPSEITGGMSLSVLDVGIALELIVILLSFFYEVADESVPDEYREKISTHKVGGAYVKSSQMVKVKKGRRQYGIRRRR